MFGIAFLAAPGGPERSPDRASPAGVAVGSRRIVLLRDGRRHGPLTRLITPWDLGELTRPFVFLGYSEQAPGARVVAGAQPGIATVTLVLSGALSLEDAAADMRTVVAGGFRWTVPGEGVWHQGGCATGEPLRAFQLWIEVAAARASSTGESQFVAPREVQEEGPARVLLGELGRARSLVAQAPPDINLLHVRLQEGQRWRYLAPAQHNVTWLAVDRGRARFEEDGCVLREQLALFGDSRGVIEVQAEGESSFVLGSARRISDAPAQARREPIDTAPAAFTPGRGEPFLFSTGSSRAVSGGAAVLRASCWSNLFLRLPSRL